MLIQITAPPLPTLISGGEDIYEVGKEHPNRYQINVFDLIVVTKGCLYMSEDENEFQIKAGESFILYPDRHHFSTKPCDQITHFYWFHFVTSEKWVELSNLKIDQESNSFNNNPFLEQRFSIRLLKHTRIKNWNRFEHFCKKALVPDKSPFIKEWKQQMMFQQLLQELSSNINIENSLPSVLIADKAAKYLRENYSKKISYKDLGEALRFHPNYIAKCMFDVFGYTPINYLNQIRLEQAKTQLIRTNLSIKQISEDCGFSQVAYFSRSFKKGEGVPPNEFRRKYARGLDMK